VLALVREELEYLLCLSNSLSQAEAWVHERVDYAYVGDYNYYSLPEATTTNSDNTSIIISRSVPCVVDIETGPAPAPDNVDFLSSDFKMTYTHSHTNTQAGCDTHQQTYHQTHHTYTGDSSSSGCSYGGYMGHEATLRRRHVYHCV
jgi:hypothetical protein